MWSVDLRSTNYCTKLLIFSFVCSSVMKKYNSYDINLCPLSFAILWNVRVNKMLLHTKLNGAATAPGFKLMLWWTKSLFKVLREIWKTNTFRACQCLFGLEWTCLEWRIRLDDLPFLWFCGLTWWQLKAIPGPMALSFG